MSFIATIMFFVVLAPHNLCAKVEIKDNTLRIEAWFDNETPADGAKVKLLANKKTLHEAITDERGLCSIPTPALGSYLIEVNAGGGHRTEVAFSLEAEVSEQTAGADKESVSQRRIWGAIIGLGVIVALTFAGRLAFRKPTS